jgi:hypothetical protein
MKYYLNDSLLLWIFGNNTPLAAIQNACSLLLVALVVISLSFNDMWKKGRFYMPEISSAEIADRAISIMNKRITNEIFLIVQNDRTLMKEYLRAVEREGLDTVNQTIGKKVRQKYQLTNSDRENNPTCTLIQSHQKFE